MLVLRYHREKKNDKMLVWITLELRIVSESTWRRTREVFQSASFWTLVAATHQVNSLQFGDYVQEAICRRWRGARALSLSLVATFFFLRKPGYIFIEKSDSLHHLAYKDPLQRKRNYKQVLVRSTRLLSSPAAGEEALEPTTLPTKKLQSLEMAPREAYRENQHTV